MMLIGVHARKKQREYIEQVHENTVIRIGAHTTIAQIEKANNDTSVIEVFQESLYYKVVS